jgi:nitrogen regulatory protein PII
MNNESKTTEIELICVIVDFGFGSKVLKRAKQYGIKGGTLTIGKGTVSNRILNFIGLSDIRKEICFMLTDTTTAYQFLEGLNKEFDFKKPNHGIAFTTSVCKILGTKSFPCESVDHEKGVENTMYHIITTIVEKGKAEDVIDAATKAGSKGGTIMGGRGSGIHETSKLFSMDIEPEKEIVLIVSEADMTDAIVSSIRAQLKIDDPGKGIIYIQNINRVYGIYK